MCRFECDHQSGWWDDPSERSKALVSLNSTVGKKAFLEEVLTGIRSLFKQVGRQIWVGACSPEAPQDSVS